MTTAIRFIDTVSNLFSGFQGVDETATEVRDPGAVRECFDQMIHGHPGCESESGAQMIMAMYPDQF
ncbi:MAG: hypothetical protein AAFN59_00430 [Pseudomonadota bacterium]